MAEPYDSEGGVILDPITSEDPGAQPPEIQAANFNHDAENFDFVRINPEEGWSITLPSNPNNGNKVTALASTISDKTVEWIAGTNENIQDPIFSPEPAKSVHTPLLGGVVSWIYESSRNLWVIQIRSQANWAEEQQPTHDYSPRISGSGIGSEHASPGHVAVGEVFPDGVEGVVAARRRDRGHGLRVVGYHAELPRAVSGARTEIGIGSRESGAGVSRAGKWRAIPTWNPGVSDFFHWFWIYRTETRTWNDAYAFGSTNSVRASFNTNGTGYFYFADGPNAGSPLELQIPGALAPDNTWEMYLLEYDRDGLMSVYRGNRGLIGTLDISSMQADVGNTLAYIEMGFVQLGNWITLGRISQFGFALGLPSDDERFDIYNGGRPLRYDQMPASLVAKLAHLYEYDQPSPAQEPDVHGTGGDSVQVFETAEAYDGPLIVQNANAPLELASTLLVNNVDSWAIADQDQQIAEDHYLIAKPSIDVPGFGWLTPIQLGPRVIYTLQQEETDAGDYNVTDAGEVEIVSMTLLNEYPIGSTYDYQIQLSEEGGRSGTFDIITRRDGNEVDRRIVNVSDGSVPVFGSVDSEVLAPAGTVIALSVVFTKGHQQADGWVRGSQMVTRIAISATT